MALTRLGPNQAVNLSTNTTGTLGVANGGTGLTSGTTDQLLKFTGSTTLASSAISTGKVLQLVNAYKTDGNSLTTSSSVSDVSALTCAITPSATSSYVYVTAIFDGQLFGNNSTTTPNGEVALVNNADTVLAKTREYNTLPANNGIADFAGVLASYYNPNTTSEISFNLTIKSDGGRFLIYGDDETYKNKPTQITVMEISA
tara:strand:+ start:762 stop:1364 length:603 start_codon:yes stop_codon:yes gene_type:complete